MKAAVIVFPGSNCDRDVRVALEHSMGKPPAMVWHRETALPAVDRILGEYVRYLSPSGQPGPGYAFMKWVFDNRANPQRCELVPITQEVGSDNIFLEFPDDPDLNGFDPSDRKFVVVALASEHSPSVLNAVDSGWWIHRAALSRHGIEIDFDCPEMMDANG